MEFNEDELRMLILGLDLLKMARKNLFVVNPSEHEADAYVSLNNLQERLVAVRDKMQG